MLVLGRKTVQNAISLPMIWMGLFLISMFINPDPYLGIADHYVFLFAFFLSFFLCKKGILINKDTKICLFMLGWLILSCVVSLISREISTGYFLSYLLYVLMLFLSNGTRYTKKEIDFLLTSYIFSAIIICIFIIVFRYDYYGSGGERITIKILNNPAIDPNYLGAFMVVPFIICYGKLLKRIKWTNCISAFLLVVGILSTASRGAMISAAGGAFITTLLYLKKEKKMKQL